MLDPAATNISASCGGPAKADLKDAERQLAELAARVGRQDEAALGELYDATVAKLFGLARAIVRNPADAEEVMLVGGHRVRAGELHIAKPGADHADLSTHTGLLVMVRSGISPLLIGLLDA